MRSLRSLVPQNIKNTFYHYPTAVLANLINGFPSKGLKVIGVTGTDGKTTTVNMIYKILKDDGKKVFALSTLNSYGFHVTSPGSLQVQKLIRQVVRQGVEYLVLEVTSHALDQGRFWGIKFDIGVITNVTYEHLDYHKTFENYLQAKAKLIKDVKFAVLNADDSSFEKLSRLTKGQVVKFGNKGNVKLSVMGYYNQANAQAALSVAWLLGIDRKKAEKSLESFKGLEGRMQQVPNRKGIKIYVDFAHTPNALEVALNSLKKDTKGRIISVFGAASERDTQKRPMMGKIAERLSDVVILTDEDPRFEDSMKIINEILSGIKSKDKVFVELDRFKAIKLAVRLSQKGDIVGIFGKGHEKSMNYKGAEKPWSDLEAVKKALNGI